MMYIINIYQTDANQLYGLMREGDVAWMLWIIIIGA
jgi:hypothetical protein